MPSVHAQVLDAASAVSDHEWTFQLADVVRALSHLNAATVRTHVASRCCVNAPSHHQKRYAYFEALGLGRYRVVPGMRPHRRPRVRPITWHDRLIAAMDSGVDRSLVADGLRMTPTDRLESMRRAAESLAAMRTR